MTTKGDKAVEQGADKLDALADKAAAKGGVGSKLADELTDDATFLRKLKPSLMVARAKGEAPKDAEPGSRRPCPVRPATQEGLAARVGRIRSSSTGAAFGLGTLLAKVIDWRGHAHPRR